MQEMLLRSEHMLKWGERGGAAGYFSKQKTRVTTPAVVAKSSISAWALQRTELWGSTLHENWVRNKVKLKWLNDGRFMRLHYWLQLKPKRDRLTNDNRLPDGWGRNKHIHPYAHYEDYSLALKFLPGCLALVQLGIGCIEADQNSQTHIRKHTKHLASDVKKWCLSIQSAYRFTFCISIYLLLHFQQLQHVHQQQGHGSISLSTTQRGVLQYCEKRRREMEESKKSGSQKNGKQQTIK